ncbi:hypothetical protein N657DRAFT_674567 [Parathielavia appendiculata]|uniref:Uncharacterized protein n=1 Tax=Parathielavia appendiculata TaxID=2587402 RepID=A0AAN6YZN3_9PEZI|nr:hypothetical protein N657DRAFT_674567 [Parathielavia appendiculata]
MDPKTIPTHLPPRYEIRVLEPKHSDWAKAIVLHSNLFYSRLWPALYPEHRTRRMYAGFRGATYLVEHQINSGHSLGVFDTEYTFKRPESVATGGTLYWDLEDESPDGDTLLAQMDFPLVSVALAYDGFHTLDMAQMAPLVRALPAFGAVFALLAQLDRRDPESWKPRAEGEVLMRNATSTRADYEGKGLMRKLAEYMMRTAAAKGFRGIQIETVSDAVCKVWSAPPEPFKGEIVCEFYTATAELGDENGQKTYPFRPAEQRITRVTVVPRVTLDGVDVIFRFQSGTVYNHVALCDGTGSVTDAITLIDSDTRHIRKTTNEATITMSDPHPQGGNLFDMAKDGTRVPEDAAKPNVMPAGEGLPSQKREGG